MHDSVYAGIRAIGRARAKAGRRARLAAAQITVSQHSRADRLVPSPVFLLSSDRSGSTLLRVVLDSHSEIVAPHELHLNQLEVKLPVLTTRAMTSMGLTELDLNNLLWDRVLHLQLIESGKRIVVDKTPRNLLTWPRINAWWPEARYLFLTRHPLRIAQSRAAARPDIPMPDHIATVRRNLTELGRARHCLNGLDVGYERFTREPEVVTHEICDYLGVTAEPEMIRYRSREFRRGLGDWTPKIRSGEIQPDRPLPTLPEIPDELRGVCRMLGYPA